MRRRAAFLLRPGEARLSQHVLRLSQINTAAPPRRRLLVPGFPGEHGSGQPSQTDASNRPKSRPLVGAGTRETQIQLEIFENLKPPVACPMILLSRREQKEATDRDFCKAVWQPAGFCISLLRPIVIIGYLSGLVLSERTNITRIGWKPSPQSQDSQLSRLGKAFAKRITFCLRCAAGEEDDFRCLIHFQAHRAGADIPD
jgi:hypothetical protein